MSDLAQRLSDRTVLLAACCDPQWAADEIERLREEVERLRYRPASDYAHECPHCGGKWLEKR